MRITIVAIFSDEEINLYAIVRYFLSCLSAFISKPQAKQFGTAAAARNVATAKYVATAATTGTATRTIIRAVGRSVTSAADASGSVSGDDGNNP